MLYAKLRLLRNAGLSAVHLSRLLTVLNDSDTLFPRVMTAMGRHQRHGTLGGSSLRPLSRSELASRSPIAMKSLSWQQDRLVIS